MIISFFILVGFLSLTWFVACRIEKYFENDFSDGVFSLSRVHSKSIIFLFLLYFIPELINLFQLRVSCLNLYLATFFLAVIFYFLKVPSSKSSKLDVGSVVLGALKQDFFQVSFVPRYILFFFLTIEFGFIFSCHPFFGVADGLLYHIPRPIEWLKQGNFNWLHTTEFRLNSFPRNAAVLEYVTLVFTGSLRVALMPTFFGSLTLLSMSLFSLAANSGYKKEIFKDSAWMSLAIIVSVAPFFLQLRAFQVDHLQLGYVVSFISFYLVERRSVIRILVCSICLILALANKPQALPVYPFASLLLLHAVWSRPKSERAKLFIVFIIFVLGSFLAVSPTLETFLRHGNPFYPFPFKMLGLNLSGVNIFSGDLTSNGFENLIEGWKTMLFSFFSIGGLSLIAADSGGYGPGFAIFAGPLLIGWCFAFYSNILIRRLSVMAIFYSSVNMFLRATGKDGKPDARYFMILLVPLVLGGILYCTSLMSGINKNLRRCFYILFSAILIYSFFKVAAVPHSSYRRAVLNLPFSVVKSFKYENSARIEQPLRIMVLGQRTTIFLGHLYGESLQNSVIGRPAMRDNYDFELPMDREERRKLCENDLESFKNDVVGFDVVVFDPKLMTGLGGEIDCYSSALLSWGWKNNSENQKRSFGLWPISNFMTRPGLILSQSSVKTPWEEEL